MATYEQLKAQAMTLLGKDLETRFKIGKLFHQMAGLVSQDTIAKDFAWPWNQVVTYITTYTYWGDTRVPTLGKVQPSWTLHVAIAEAPEDEQEPLRIAAMSGGASAFREKQHELRGTRPARVLEKAEQRYLVWAEENPEEARRDQVWELTSPLSHAARHFQEYNTLSDEDSALVLEQFLALSDELKRLGVIAGRPRLRKAS